MKRSKKPRVSWPPGPKLCQVKLFRREDCPANVTSEPQLHTGEPGDPDVPPGFEGHHYAVKPKIPMIKWKRPTTKIVLSDTWMVANGEDSTERHDQNLRIIKLSEAIYPHRSAIPSGPSVSPAVKAEHFDDSKTPVIRTTPIEDDECKPAEESSLDANELDQLRTKLLSLTEALVSDRVPNLRVVATAALAALMKTQEQGSLVDPDLLIKFLTDPKIVKNLLTDTAGISSETKSQPVDANINPTRLVVPQQVTASPIATKPQPVIVPQEQRFAVAKPFTSSEQRRVSPPKPGNGNISSLNPLYGNPTCIPMPVHSSIGLATQPPLPVRFPPSPLPMNLNLQRPQYAFPEPKVIVNPQPQLQPYPEFRTPEMNNFQAPVGFGRGPPPLGFSTYPMNLNQADATCRPNYPVAQPTKGAHYFKNLIREHGAEMNQYHTQIKIPKPCIYFGSARGCAAGDNCIYVHNRLRPNFETEAPMAKRMMFGRYDRNGL